MDQLALVTILLALGAVGGFTGGWVAKRDETRAYLASRERYWQQRLAEAQCVVEQRCAAADSCHRRRKARPDEHSQRKAPRTR